MFIMAKFTAKLWNYPMCPSIDNWIKKMWYKYAMELNSSIKKNKSIPLAGKRMDLEIIMLYKISETQTSIRCFLCRRERQKDIIKSGRKTIRVEDGA